MIFNTIFLYVGDVSATFFLMLVFYCVFDGMFDNLKWGRKIEQPGVLPVYRVVAWE